MIVFDIETGPLPGDQIARLIPKFDGGHPGEFDPRAVKLGNCKDPVKIDQKIREAADAHREAIAAVGAKQAEQKAKWMERAALSPTTGQVLAVGFKSSTESHRILFEMSERELIELTFSIFTSPSCDQFVGHNIHNFDLPFLVRRAWLLGLDVPYSLRVGRYWSPMFVDTMDVWSLGNRGEMISLDTLAKACGLPGKPDGVNGGDFAKLLATDRDAAIAYLKNDLEMTWAVAERLQIF